ncbi:hypothetical protein [Runella aurantiaca]|uniref:Lipoprotein n=1 Tax=Runella aurantiaca TaxID=2282308 RepID=A0A369IHB5_9BACT|nr:hypothetical protein [Runella aurantiaca]RDB06674.1 hypothetical protein DVG78_08025 [Runella aurantiaca]
MKRILSLLLVLGVLVTSCSKPEQQQGESAASTTPDFKTTTVALPFSGYWLSESYFNDIKTHQSPQKSQEGSEEVFVVIPDSTLQPTMMVWNFHEGSEEITVLKKDGAYQLYEVVIDSLTRALKDIKIISPTKIEIGNKAFVKISPHAKPNEKNNPFILEEILFKGKYSLADGKEVEFKNNGEVTGLENYRYYQPAIDYIGPGLQIDQVSLSSTEDRKEWMAFKFRGDTLRIYQIKCIEFDKSNNECGLADFGALKHTLVRKK